MKTNKNWFSDMLSGANGDISSKRFFGGIGIMIMHALAVLAVFKYPDSNWIGELLITLTVTDGGLLGVGVLEKRTKTSKSQSTDEELDETEG